LIGRLKIIRTAGRESPLYLSVEGKKIMAKMRERTSFNEGDDIEE